LSQSANKNIDFKGMTHHVLVVFYPDVVSNLPVSMGHYFVSHRTMELYPCFGFVFVAHAVSRIFATQRAERWPAFVSDACDVFRVAAADF
jgi:hypothetical protein